MTITSTEYFKHYAGHPEITQAMRGRADAMLGKVNPLLEYAQTDLGWTPLINPFTKCLVGGSGNAGWRPQDCAIGAPQSSHKQARAVDVFDPDNALDKLLTDEILEQFGLYREHPDATNHWCHLTDKAPGSGRRSFYP